MTSYDFLEITLQVCAMNIVPLASDLLLHYLVEY